MPFPKGQLWDTSTCNSREFSAINQLTSQQYNKCWGEQWAAPCTHEPHVPQTPFNTSAPSSSFLTQVRKKIPSSLFPQKSEYDLWYKNFCLAAIQQKKINTLGLPWKPNCITTPRTGAKVTEFWWKGGDNLRHWEISCRGDALITSQINNASVVKLNINHIFCINYRGWLVRAPGERGWDSKGLSHPPPSFFIPPPSLLSLSLSLHPDWFI